MKIFVNKKLICLGYLFINFKLNPNVSIIM